MTSETDPRFEALLQDLKEQRSFDFTGYKRASLLRRIQRRMQTVGIEDVDDYRDHLAVSPDEFTALFNTILINVTSFFRDRDAWQLLSDRVVPQVVAARQGQPMRAWSAGCASGEEAYSLAMVFAELLGVDEFRERVKIYATDIDDEALSTARAAVYSERDVQGVPDELREKYFERQGERWSFGKELRRSVIFGRNDLVQDAPISHVDILTCRNTLMYFNAETQAQIVQRLHFALNPRGVLFLGKAEMLLSHAGYFRPLELKRRFFTKTGADAPDRRLAAPTPPSVPDEDAIARALLRQAAFMSSAAAQFVLDAQRRLVYANARASHLFGTGSQDTGRPIQDLEVSYRPIELRSHIDQAVKERRQVWIRDVAWNKSGADPVSFDLQVVPLLSELGNLLGTTIIFNDVTHYRQLQHELEQANRQLETAYEELQSTNEELETTNEELQSTVEELETTNEELQSMNDELQLTNESLQERQAEVDRLNTFMTSVLGSMSAGVAVVDRDLRITAWNDKAADLWGIRTDEALGRHLLNLDIGLPLDRVRPLLRRQIGQPGREPDSVRVEAINRRGRTIELQVTVTDLDYDGDGHSAGAIMVMDTVGGAHD